MVWLFTLLNSIVKYLIFCLRVNKLKIVNFKILEKRENEIPAGVITIKDGKLITIDRSSGMVNN